MNTNRHIIWGIGLSLLVHGLLLGLLWSPRGQHSVPVLRTLPLEITLIGPKPRKDTPPEPKPIPQFRPKRVKRLITVQKKEIIGKRKKPPAVVKSNPTPIIKDEPITPPREEIPTIPPASVSPASQKEIADTNPPVAKEKVEEPPLVTPEVPAQGENVQTSLIPREGNSARNGRITLARPRYDRNPKPRYPRIARRRGYEGLVVLKVEILPDGRVGKVRVKRSSGHHILDKSALKTVKMWRFIPARQGDDPIRMWAEVPIKFDLE